MIPDAQAQDRTRSVSNDSSGGAHGQPGIRRRLLAPLSFADLADRQRTRLLGSERPQSLAFGRVARAASKTPHGEFDRAAHGVRARLDPAGKAPSTRSSRLT